MNTIKKNINKAFYQQVRRTDDRFNCLSVWVLLAGAATFGIGGWFFDFAPFNNSFFWVGGIIMAIGYAWSVVNLACYLGYLLRK